MFIYVGLKGVLVSINLPFLRPGLVFNFRFIIPSAILYHALEAIVLVYHNDCKIAVRRETASTEER